MALKTKINFNELPFNDFKKIGIQRNHLEKLNPSNRFNLLNSYPTGLLKLETKEIKSVGRIFVRPDKKGKLKINIIPKISKVQNNIGLSNVKFDKMKKTGFANAIKVNKKGLKVPYLFQLDKKTNQILGIEKSKIKPPKKIANIALSKQQIDKIASGKSITLKTNKGAIDVKLDLTKARGFSSMKSKDYSKNQSLSKSTKIDLTR